MNVLEKLQSLRSKMKEHGIDAYIVPNADPHQSEYVPEEYKVRAFLTGFTGSAGTAIITADEAYLWTDGRYFIQAERELAGSTIGLMKQRTPGYPDEKTWLYDNLKEGAVVGFNGFVMAETLFESFDAVLSKKNISYVDDVQLVEDMWSDRPAAPEKEAFEHEIKFTGASTAEKIARVRETMKAENADVFIISGLEDIAYLMNFRGYDIECNPVVTSYVILDDKNVALYVNEKKINASVRKMLESNGVEIKPYDGIIVDIEKIDGKVVVLDKSRTSRRLYTSLAASNTINHRMDITSDMKCCKNEVELAHQKNAYLKDAIALVNYFYWLKTAVKNGESITEYDAQERLEEFRREQEGFIMPSFDSISAYAGNGAMMHYKAKQSTAAKILPRGLYLIDSGGQYFDGTTDITRTLAMGELTEEEIRDYTLTLQSHLNLCSAVFLEGTTGHQLDVLSRIPIWRARMDYKCGTGHGVGYLLCVHEGPHRIAPVANNVAMREGMVVTVEPGVYKEEKHGIRIENVVAVKKDELTTDGQFYVFDMLSYIPFEREAINVSMLNEFERTWINDYHKKVYELLHDKLSSEVAEYLREATAEI